MLNTITLTDADMMDFASEYHLKIWLQEQGFPMVGIVDLQPDKKNYIYMKKYNPIDGTHIYTWRKYND